VVVALVNAIWRSSPPPLPPGVRSNKPPKAEVPALKVKIEPVPGQRVQGPNPLNKPPDMFPLANEMLKPGARVVSAKSSVVVGEPVAACHALRLVYVVTLSAWAELLPNSNAAPIINPDANLLIVFPPWDLGCPWLELNPNSLNRLGN
jgi:hypothetical protein